MNHSLTYFLSVLFSSSSKYPEINCLDSFVSYHGGTIHAYTELEFVSLRDDGRRSAMHCMINRQWLSSRYHRIVWSKLSIFSFILSLIHSCHSKASMISFKWSTMKVTSPRWTITIEYRVSWPIWRERTIHWGSSLGVKIYSRFYSGYGLEFFRE